MTRGATERLVPILMTALAAGLALVPIAMSMGEAGSEIQAPMALVILLRAREFDGAEHGRGAGAVRTFGPASRREPVGKQCHVNQESTNAHGRQVTPFVTRSSVQC